jgi:hypothetical protein
MFILKRGPAYDNSMEPVIQMSDSITYPYMGKDGAGYELYEITIRILIFALWFGGSTYCASRKGYNPWFFVIGGLLSLVVLAFLPFTNKAQPPTLEDIKNRVRGNWIGLGCSLGAGLVALPLMVLT